jgi:hypothetical protein
LSEFFRGWRRKLGIVTLLMACIVMVEWIRSLTNSTQFSVRAEKDACVGIQSANQVFSLFYWRFNHPSMNWDAQEDIEFVVYPFAEQPGAKNWPQGEFRWRIGDFGWQDSSIGPDHRMMQFIAPHWSIAVPLSLLSAFWLLIKPRTSNQRNIIEPASIEGP